MLTHAVDPMVLLCCHAIIILWLLVLFLVDLDDLPSAAFVHLDDGIHSSAAGLKKALTVLGDPEKILPRLKGDDIGFVDVVHIKLYYKN